MEREREKILKSVKLGRHKDFRIWGLLTRRTLVAPVLTTRQQGRAETIVEVRGTILLI
jgi:hypothetical protein